MKNTWQLRMHRGMKFENDTSEIEMSVFRNLDAVEHLC